MRAIPARLGQGAAVRAHLVRRQIVDIGLAGLYQVLGPLIKLFEIIGGEFDLRSPIEAKPADIFLNGIDKFLFFLGRVGIVEPKIAAPAELLGNTEIQADRFGMTDMQIAVGFRWKSRHDRFYGAAGQIRADLVADEIVGGLRAVCFVHVICRRVWASVVHVCQKIRTEPTRSCVKA